MGAYNPELAAFGALTRTRVSVSLSKIITKQGDEWRVVGDSRACEGFVTVRVRSDYKSCILW